MSSDLEAELELLRTTLEMKGAELHNSIKEERQRKEAELQVRDILKKNSFLIFEIFILQSSCNISYYIPAGF